MAFLTLRRSWAVIALVLAWALVPAAVSAAPAVPAPGDGDKAKNETPAESIRKTLDQPITLELADQQLAQAVNALREKTKINFVLDAAALQLLAQIDPTQGQPVSLHVHDVKLKTALRTMLSGHNLTYVIVGDTVVITTEDLAMYRQLHQHVNLDFDDVPLTKAMRQLARDSGANLVVDAKVNKEAETKVTLQLDDVPLETAVRLLCETVGLKPVRMGNVLYVTSKANATELRSDPELTPPAQPGQPGQEMIIRGGIAFPGGFPGGGTVPVLPPTPVPEIGDIKQAPDPQAPDKPAPIEKDKPAPTEKPAPPEKEKT